MAKQRHWCKIHKVWHSAHKNILCWMMHSLTWVKNMKEAQEDLQDDIFNRRNDVLRLRAARKALRKMEQERINKEEWQRRVFKNQIEDALGQ